MTTRSGPVPFQRLLRGVHYDWVTGGNSVTGTEYGVDLYRVRHMPINQVNKKVNGRWLPGGDWFAIETTITEYQDGDPAIVHRPGYGRAYEGRLSMSWTGRISTYWNYYRDLVSSSSYVAEFMQQSENYAVEGFAKARPDAPIFSMSNSLFELREVPKQLKRELYELLLALTVKRRLTVGGYIRYNRNRKDPTPGDLARRSADNLLAGELGWIPLLADIKNFVWSCENLVRRLKDLLRNAGKPTIRRRRLRDVYRQTVTQNVTHTGGYNPNVTTIFVTQCYGNAKATTYETETITETVHFVGEFLYHLPKIDSLSKLKKLARKLMGLNLSPGVVWNMLPWTWFVDYFTNLGETIESLTPTSVAESCVVNWGYIVRKRTVTLERVCTSYLIGPDGNQRRVVNRLVVESTVKSRKRVHPFGVASPGQMTARQWSIAGALGLSRGLK